MLDLALRVVEAARDLKLVQKGDRTAPSLKTEAELMAALSNLRQAIEEFDAESSHGLPAMTIKHRPDFATPPQLNDDGVNEDELSLPVVLPGHLTSEHSLDGDEVALPTPKPKKRITQLPKPVLAAAVMTGLVSQLKPSTPAYDLGDDGVFFDGDESAADLMLAMDAINDKLTFAVNKVGWTPRLRAMAEAMRIAQHNMYIEVENGQGWVRVPAHNWGTLSVSIAEAALDQDLTIALPQPKPWPKHDLDEELEASRRYAPRPPHPQ